jgi:decaprenylphospho-beta-D-ribofuranose 2-oxidase
MLTSVPVPSRPLHPPDAPAGSPQSLAGWGGRPRSTATVHRPASSAEVQALWGAGDVGVARGLGRSYGDAAQAGGGIVTDMTGVRGILDLEGGSLTAWAGTSLDEIIVHGLPRGWFLPVTPGTRHVTLGGAIAADVHGKNHHADGTFGTHVTQIQLLTADGRLLDLRPGDEAFAATVGGMGLTGAIIRATVRLIPVAGAAMTVDVARAPTIDHVMDELSRADQRRRYTVAWLDLTARSRGRGIVMAGDHAPAEVAGSRARATATARRLTAPLPPLPGQGVISPATVRAFNEAWFRMAPRESHDRPQALDRFFYPLDGLQGWNRLYGDDGFLQYQFVVPTGEEETLLLVAEVLTAAATPAALTVLKRMGPQAGGILSFPMEGWTLTVDMPLGDPDLARLLDDCDRVLADVGGRLYLAKDSRLRADTMAAMYPALPRWREERARLDPHSAIRSDMGDRLRLS